MKVWLRWTLVITQVGGGFTGIAMNLGNMLSLENISPPTWVILIFFTALYAFIVIAGMLLVQDEYRITPLRIALWLQVPLISSPFIAWQFSSGLRLNLNLIGNQIGMDFWLGSTFQLYLLNELPWGIGINLFAVLMLILLNGLRKSQIKTPPAITQQIDSILQSNLLTTPLADRGIQLRTSPNGDIRVLIGSTEYTSVDEVPDTEVKLQIKLAVEEWERSSQPIEPSAPDPIRMK